MDDILNGKTVLITDDMGVLRVLVSGLLRGAGVNAVEASSGDQALSIIHAQRIDAFILDINMPGMGGIELCKIIRKMERHRNTPVVFISSMDETHALEEALEAGGDEFIGKPIHFVVLRARLRNLMQRANFINRERLMSLSLQRYVSPRTEQIARRYAETGVLPATRREEACLLFSDVRGFTEMSQDMEPEALFQVLSGHLSTLVSYVYRHGGYVDKFSGDGLMAVFDGKDMVYKCCMCALDMLDASRERLEKEGIRIHQMGIGINKGEVVIGNLGSSEHFDYTMIGRTVNLAARLCSMAQSLSIVVSEAVRNEVAGGAGLAFVNQRSATVRGFRDPITIFDMKRG